MHISCIGLISYFICIIQIIYATNTINEYEYNLLPQLMDADSYYFCQTQIIPHKYCLFEIKIKYADNVTELTRYNFELLNSDPRNFHHGNLVRGRCLRVADNETRRSDEIQYYTAMFNKELLKDGFQVGNITHITCDGFKKQMDVYDIAGIGVLTFIAILVSVCTLVDACFIYRSTHDRKLSVAIKIMTCFSLIRNVIRFYSFKQSKENLNFVHGIRFITIALIIFGHNVFLTLNAPWHKVNEFEETYDTIATAIIINGPVVVQTYFFLSGMFLGYGFYKFIFTHKFHIKYILLAIIGRYNRLTPSFFILTLVNATVLYHLGSGIFWEKNIGLDRMNCRQNWWYNLIYISNELKSDEMCLLPGWFMSADFQLFLFSLCLLTLIWFKKEWLSFILYTTLVISILIPGIITYHYKLDPLTLNYPETLRNIFANNLTFHMTYLQAHTNASSFILGLIIGYYLYTGAITKTLPDKYGLKLLGHILGWSCACGVLFGAYLYCYADTYEYNRVLASIIASLYKIVFTMVPALVVYGAKCGWAKLNVRILEWKPFIVLGRLSFAIYLVHWPLLRVETSLEKVPVVYTHFNVIAIKYVANLVLSILLAMILALFVEFPVSALTKLFMEPSREPSEQNNKTSTVITNSTPLDVVKETDLPTNGKFCYSNEVVA